MVVVAVAVVGMVLKVLIPKTLISRFLQTMTSFFDSRSLRHALLATGLNKNFLL